MNLVVYAIPIFVLLMGAEYAYGRARNPFCLDRNYGGVFIVWDRLFGTYQGERPEEPCVYGITHPLASWNPLWANLHARLETVRDSLKTRRWRDKFDPPSVSGSGPLMFAQYWLVTAAALTLLILAGDLPRPFVLIGVAVLAGYGALSLATVLWLPSIRSQPPAAWTSGRN